MTRRPAWFIPAVLLVLCGAGDARARDGKGVAFDPVAVAQSAILRLDQLRDRALAMAEARGFVKSFAGQINVVDTGGVIPRDGAAHPTGPRKSVRAELQVIAQEGGGSAFLLQDDQAFWRHLIVSIFGQRFEQDIQQIIDTYVKPPQK